MIKQAEKHYNSSMLEKRIQDFWEKTKAYERTKELRKSGEDYYFIDGPPYTTGAIHLGTAWNKTIKDMIVRYRRMQNYNIRDQAGFDMHGLPIEVQVEQKLGIKNKKEIEKLGIDKFVTTCRDFSLKLQKKMTEQFKGLGVWLDWDNPYLTIQDSYIESAWWTLKKAHEKNLLTKAKRVLSWCPRCETALAEAEIEYWDEEDPSIYVKFPIKGRRDEYILIWTTTPWTIPANLAIAVHPNFTYARVKTRKGEQKEVYILLEDRVDEVAKLAGFDAYTIIERIKGKELVGIEYFHPLRNDIPYQEKIKGKWTHKILASETVTAENTGCVHIAPGHGPEDFDVGIEYNIPPFCPVDESGFFTLDVGKRYKGEYVKNADEKIIKDLRDMNFILFDSTVTHRYGHCWRCKTPIIYRVTTQWFLEVTELKNKMLEEIDKIDWTPEWAGSSRQKDWVENARDWCISRQRYWGIPIPVWECKCGEIKIIGSIEELKEGDNYEEGMNLHRPWIDKITFKCPKCNKEMKRIEDIVDVWFEAGICSWAQLNYPTQKEQFERWWPCRWITEAHDQTRGWFYSQLGSSTIVFGKAPYNSVLMHGWLLDSKGQPMSKSLGNVIKPQEVIDKYGVDSLRFYFLKTNAPWEDINFSMDGVKEANRTLNILWNVYVFSTLYMSIDNFDPSISLEELKGYLQPEDEWLLSKIESLKLKVTESIEKYELHKTCRAIEHFILEDLSRWYVKLIRERTWIEGEDKKKLSAYKVLHEALLNLSKLLAPIVPHISEAIYQNLDARLLSVHMCDWPVCNPSLINHDLEKSMVTAQNIVEVVSKIRQKKGLKLRWPLKRMAVKASSDEIASSVKSLKSVILRQTNAKDIEVILPGEEWSGMALAVKPNPEAIGKVYRQWSSKIARLLEARPAEKIKEEMEKGEYKIGIEGQLVKIQPDMVTFTTKLPENVVCEEFEGGMIYVDLEITDEIKAEGFAREFIRRIQQMRKEIDMDVEDFVDASISISKEFAESLTDWCDLIKYETRCRRLEFVDGEVDEDYVVEWLIEGETVTIGISPLYMKEAITSFTKIPGITTQKAIALFEASYKNEEQLEKAKSEDLIKIDGIDALQAEKIREYFEMPKTERIKKEERCPLCNGIVDPSDEICGRCGQKLVVKEKKALEKKEEKKREAIELKKTFTYLIKEEKPKQAYNLLADYTKRGLRGFCVTRTHPNKVKEGFDLKDTAILWLSNVGGEKAVRAKDLEKLSLAFQQFLAKGEGIALLDGIEYLITHNDFPTILRFIQSLKDLIAISQSILLLSLNPSALGLHQLTLLEKEMDVVIG